MQSAVRGRSGRKTARNQKRGRDAVIRLQATHRGMRGRRIGRKMLRHKTIEEARQATLIQSAVRRKSAVAKVAACRAEQLVSIIEAPIAVVGPPLAKGASFWRRTTKVPGHLD